MKNLPETKLKRSIKQGDILQLGTHILVCGDATDSNLVKAVLKDQSISLLLTDPPFGVNYTASKGWLDAKISHDKEILNDHIQTEEKYMAFTTAWLKPIVPFFTRKNACYIFNMGKMLFPMHKATKQLSYRFSQLLVWVKSNPVIGRLDYLPQHEFIWYGWFGRHEFKKSKDKSILFCPKPNKSKYHPTTKPITLLRRLILNSTNIGDTIYDCFGGSGSTLLAAEQTKRKCIMFEIDPEYCETIARRFERLTNIKAKVI